MLKEPQLSDFIYEEIRQCEKYALLNLITFEAAIRNAEVMKILNDLNAMSSEERLDALLEGDKEFCELTEKLREEYFLDYNTYVEYTRGKKVFLETYADERDLDPDYQSIVDEIQAEYAYDTDDKVPSVKDQVELYKKNHVYNLIVNHDLHASHTHHLSLPLYRPKMHILQRESTIHIDVPMYHIHPRDMKDYYASLAKKHLEIMGDAADYYKEEKLFFDIVSDAKSGADTYATMFFVWDYVAWWKQENETFTPDSTAGMLYAEIADMIGATIDDTSGRSSKIEKNLEVTKKFIDKCGYKQLYIPKSE